MRKLVEMLDARCKLDRGRGPGSLLLLFLLSPRGSHCVVLPAAPASLFAAPRSRERLDQSFRWWARRFSVVSVRLSIEYRSSFSAAESHVACPLKEEKQSLNCYVYDTLTGRLASFSVVSHPRRKRNGRPEASRGRASRPPKDSIASNSSILIADFICLCA